MQIRLTWFALACGVAQLAMAAPPGVHSVEGVPYVENGDPAQVLDLYLPETPSAKPLPLVIWIHGGAWSGGNLHNAPSQAFVRDGYAAASIEYRFTQKAKFPAQVQDCQAAIRWLRANAKTYNIDPDHIGVWGESAGGHLVALLGTDGGKNTFPKVGGNTDVSDRVQAVADQSGPINFATIGKQADADDHIKKPYFVAPNDVFTRLLGVPINTDAATDAFASPITYVDKDSPPFLILHGAKDPLVPLAQAKEMNDALQKAGVTVLLQIFPEGGHNGWPFASGPGRKVVRTFFDKYLKGSAEPVAMLSEQDAMLPPPPKKN